MITEQRKCKYCGKPVYLEIDEDYARLGDWLKLSPMAACNRCADLREEKRGLEGKIRAACYWTENLKPEEKKKLEAKLTKRFTLLAEKYAKFVAKWYGFSGMTWDPEFPTMLRDHPEKWPAILAQYWKCFRQLNPPKLLP